MVDKASHFLFFFFFLGIFFGDFCRYSAVFLGRWGYFVVLVLKKRGLSLFCCCRSGTYGGGGHFVVVVSSNGIGIE